MGTMHMEVEISQQYGEMNALFPRITGKFPLQMTCSYIYTEIGLIIGTV
jgi:hypothetical protein